MTMSLLSYVFFYLISMSGFFLTLWICVDGGYARLIVCLVIPRWQTRVVHEKRWKAIFRSVMLLLRLWRLLTACRCHVGWWSTVVYWCRIRLLLWLLLISISPWCIVVFIIIPISIIVCHFILVAVSTVPNAARLLSSLIWLVCAWEWHMKRVKEER